MSAMDMMERRIREVVASLLSKGARALERTAGELDNAASELRQERERQREEAERAWSEEQPPRREPDRMIRSAPLRAVPDTPADEDVAPDEALVADPDAAPAVDAAWTPPAEPPEMPPAEPPELSPADRPGEVDAKVTTSTTVAGPTDPVPDRIAQIAQGTVGQARAQLTGLTDDELRQLRAVEAAGRKRTTLIAAIDRVIAER